MLLLAAALILSAGFLFPCHHGPLCDARTITFDASAGADFYTLYWKTSESTDWAATVDSCPSTCPESGMTAIPPQCEVWAPYPYQDNCIVWGDAEYVPCRESCMVYIVHPQTPGEVVYFSLTASNAGGEGGH